MCPTPNPLNYVNYDFDELKANLINRLRATDAWKDVYESSTGQMLIEFFACIANLNLYYLERRAEECYIGTAQNKSSVINLVRLINYTPQRKISAVGVLTFSIASVSTKRIFIPQYTECQTANALKFVTISDMTIEPGQLNNTITAIQGMLVEAEFTGDGSVDQKCSINDTSVENDEHLELGVFRSFRVFVDGVEWTRVTSFLDSDNTDTHYVLRAELDDTLTVVFGDDVNGKAPEIGDIIQVRYVRSDGSDGNVYETDKVTTLNDTLYDEDGSAVTVSVTNSTVMTGGDNAEDIEEIRIEAPAVFQTGDRAVTKLDYEAIILNYGSVANVNVWGENEESAPNYDMFNVVRLCVLLDGWYLPSETFKDNLSTHLYDLSMLTVKYEYIDAAILYIIVVLDVKVVEGYSLSQTQADIEAALEAEFVLGSTTKLGTSKYISNLIDAVDSLAAVSYHHMILEIRKELTAGYDSNYDYGTILEATSIITETVKIYVGTDQVAVDNGLGGFTDLSSVYTVSGAVNYTTGVIGVDITPAPTDVVSVRYRQDADGDIIVDNKEICKLYDVEFTTISYDT